ncbi:MAG TPA: septal ring lytic transglycosylase RlpA family protein [Candidatus Tectomicrobia bacterium]
MRTLFMVLGFRGLLLAPVPEVASGRPAKPTQMKTERVKIRQVGWASWYGAYHQGRQTASGERFSRRHLTAAHRSLPLGTKVQVTNLRTKRQVVVTINDRGPYVDQQRRIIDLSEAAARRVGMREHGVERVEVVVVEPAS